MQIPFLLVRRFVFSAELVWRLSEFAFLCGYFGSRTFLLEKKTIGIDIGEK